MLINAIFLSLSEIFDKNSTEMPSFVHRFLLLTFPQNFSIKYDHVHWLKRFIFVLFVLFMFSVDIFTLEIRPSKKPFVDDKITYPK